MTPIKMKPLTTTLSLQSISFIEKQAKELRQPKNAIIEEAIKLYERQKKAEAIQTGLQERATEYREINDEFFSAQENLLSHN